jgi:predicted RNA-binding Zn-ribbon protein involved in translation (DUF1610 family)
VTTSPEIEVEKMDKVVFRTEEWAKRLAESLGEMQDNGTGEGFPCPRCGYDRMREPVATNALSRYASVYICPECGIDEAIRDMAGKSPLPFLEWGMPMGFMNEENDNEQ